MTKGVHIERFNNWSDQSDEYELFVFTHLPWPILVSLGLSLILERIQNNKTFQVDLRKLKTSPRKTDLLSRFVEKQIWKCAGCQFYSCVKVWSILQWFWRRWKKCEIIEHLHTRDSSHTAGLGTTGKVKWNAIKGACQYTNFYLNRHFSQTFC